MKIYKGMVAIPPGETIKEGLEHLGMTQAEFSKRMGMAEKTISQIINGEAPISYETSLKLENVLGKPASMWNKLEARYQEVVARIEEEKQLEEELEVCKKFPTKELEKRGWIAEGKGELEKVKEMKNYFSVASLEALWNVEAKFFNYCETQRALFRKNENKKINEYNMISWIRKGEIEASKIETEAYSKAGLKAAIPEMRGLSKVNSKESLDRLKEICRLNGIALVILDFLPKTFVKGVSQWLNKDKAMIILSNHGKLLNLFWFNFFHELGHILNHSKKELFLNIENIELNDIEEEANRFARDVLIPKKDYKKLIKMERTREKFIELGKELDIHPSIPLGFLQYEGFVEYTEFNDLKPKLIYK